MTDLAPYAAVLSDVAAWDPDLRPSLCRDYERLCTVSLTRGSSFITEDLPAACKVFDFALSRGWFDRLSLPKTFGKGITKDGRGYFLKQLFGKVFEEDGSLRENADPKAVFFVRQILLLGKKLDIPHSKESEIKSVDEFIRIENEMRRPTLQWDLDELTTHRRISLSFLDGYRVEPDLISHRDMCPRPLLRMLDAVSERITNLFPAFDWRDLTPRHGPGAVADVKSGNDKYSFPHWPRKLDLTFPYEYFAQTREDLHLEVDKPVSSHEPFAKLSAVPKDQRGPRLITIEPVAHQYLQQAVLVWLRRNFPQPLRLCVYFKNQALSRRLAIASSATGELATVDLSSASDRLSCWSIERAFSRHKHGMGLLEALHACRTRGIKISLGGKREFLVLRKYAGQGNATTFPVQSIFYVYVAIAAVLFESGRAPSYNNICWAAKQVRVYGDDIIMPSFAVRSLVDLLDHNGLKVNVGKSHFTGKFRESCGADAFNGVEVTPTYMRHLSLSKSSDLVSWVDVRNNAYRKGLTTLAEWMTNQIPDKVLKLIAISNTTQSCLTLHTSQDSTQFSGRRRYNKHLHRTEYLALQGWPKTASAEREEYDGLLQYFLEAPMPDELGVFPIWKACYVVRKRSLIRKRWVSPL